ncbi:MAG TPA: GNAT family N-acetyltransferase [Chitinophagaceae bacterium]|jgi:ribosomal protein S18 acetylase RimI-like enzyme|nr:GNAT family N-acetyltransferase [Chitinophagaceae bacterium]
MTAIATTEDIDALELLVNSAYRGESSKKGWTTEADLLDGIRIDKERLEEIIRNSDSVILKMIDEDGIITGCVNLQKKHDSMFLGMLTVKPGAQGSGLGKRLMQEAEEYARLQGCSRMVMTVISVRSELIAWYERRGYHLTGEKKPFPSNDPRFGMPKIELEFAVMEKQL